MKKISSALTFFFKRVFPVLWFGLLALAFLVAATTLFSGKKIDVMSLAVPAILAVLGYFMMKNMVFDLADEAWDAGDSIVVRNKGIEVRIPLADIINISYSVLTNPPRVTLRLREPSRLGKELSFSPLLCWFPFQKSPLVTDLISRVDEARRR